MAPDHIPDANHIVAMDIFSRTGFSLVPRSQSPRPVEPERHGAGFPYQNNSGMKDDAATPPHYVDVVDKTAKHDAPEMTASIPPWRQDEILSPLRRRRGGGHDRRKQAGGRRSGPRPFDG